MSAWSAVSRLQDNQPPSSRRASTILRVVVGRAADIVAHFSQPIYTANFTKSWNTSTEILLNQPLVAEFPSIVDGRVLDADDIRYELVPSADAASFELDARSARLFLTARPFDETPPIIELTVKVSRREKKGLLASLVAGVCRVCARHGGHITHPADRSRRASAYILCAVPL